MWTFDAVFIVKNRYHRELLFLPSFKNPPCQTTPKTNANLQRKPPYMGSKEPSSVNVVCLACKLSPNRAVVCRCARLCSVIACHHLILLMAIPDRARSTFHLSKSWALVQLRPWLSIAVLSYALPLDKALKHLHFLSNRFSSPNDAAYASVPVIDALTTRDKKMKSLWFHGERANQNPRNADQFAVTPAICTRFPLCFSQ